MERIATVDKMVEVISEDNQPALTKQDIADALDVSWQTVNNHEDELKADPRVESGKIGKAQVFWLTGDSPRETQDHREGESGPPRQRGRRGAEEEPAEGRSSGRLFNLFKFVRDTARADLWGGVPAWLYLWAVLFAISPALVATNLMAPEYLQSGWGLGFTLLVLAGVAGGLAVMTIALFMRASEWLDERAAGVEESASPALSDPDT